MSKVINKAHYAQSIAGKKISSVRSLTKLEMDELMWFESVNPTCVIEFTDNTFALVMADPEGNGTGFLDIGSY